MDYNSRNPSLEGSFNYGNLNLMREPFLLTYYKGEKL